MYLYLLGGMFTYVFVYLFIIFCSALLGGMFVIDKSKEAIWSMHNSGVRY